MVELSKHDCRFCAQYRYERSGEVESFSCEKGYFNFTEDDDGRRGNIAEVSSLLDKIQDLPCKGEDFVFGPTTGRWRELAKKYEI